MARKRTTETKGKRPPAPARDAVRGLPSEAELLARLGAQGNRPQSLPSLEQAFEVPVERGRDFSRMLKRLEETGKVRRLKGHKYVRVPEDGDASAPASPARGRAAKGARVEDRGVRPEGRAAKPETGLPTRSTGWGVVRREESDDSAFEEIESAERADREETLEGAGRGEDRGARAGRGPREHRGRVDASKGSRWAPGGGGREPRNRDERRKHKSRYPGRQEQAPREEGLVRGKLVKQGGFHFLQPLRAEEGRLSDEAVLIPKRELGGARPGDIVTVRVLSEQDGERMGKVIGTLGHGIAFADVAKAFFKEYSIPYGYPKKALAEAATFPEPVFEDHPDRVDYRGKHVITIDPSTAKDHDDAISLEKDAQGNWNLGVHIADVSEYVLPDTALDQESLLRAFTQYLPWTAAPMLPHRLSSDLCSLLEHRERLAFSCIMTVSPDGELLDFDFEETFIRVAKFYSYEAAQGAREEGEPFLAQLDEFTSALLSKRRRDGFIDFQFPEPKVELDGEGVPARMYIGERLASHSWIEECMLLANQATARYLTKHKVPGLFRVHEQPDIDAVAGLWASQGAIHKDKGMAEALKKLDQTRTFLNPAVQKFFIRLLSQEGGALPASVQRKILQSMKKAQYSAEPLGHFALGWTHYAHFTSPIRRYADLWTHRVIKAFLRGGKVPRNLKTRAADVADMISEREISVMKVERKGLKTATAWVLRQYIGEEFTGEVSGAENFGLFVSINNPYGEGLVPVRYMRDDYYEKDEDTGHLVGRRSGNRFQLGDKVKVRLERSDPFTSQVDFSYLGRA